MIPTRRDPKKVILEPGLMKPSSSLFFLMKWGCTGHWGHWGCWGCRGHWGCKGSKAWKITTDDCRVIQVPKFSFILMFWKQIFFVRIMKYQVEFWHLLSWRLLRPAYVNFLKIGGWNSNVQISWSHWAPWFNKIIDLSIPQSHLVSSISIWYTL